MDILHPRCAGLDVHRDSVVVCARLIHRGRVEQHVETFGTTTSELERLSLWLSGHGVTHVAMEATGVYWKPVWIVLVEAFELVLANAMHVKNVPGRKTDVNDAMWLADLLGHGRIRWNCAGVRPTPRLAPAGSEPGSVPAAAKSLRPCAVGSPPTSACCCASTSRRRMRSMRGSPRSTTR